jgi:hypothetical protein
VGVTCAILLDTVQGLRAGELPSRQLASFLQNLLSRPSGFSPGMGIDLEYSDFGGCVGTYNRFESLTESSVPRGLVGVD